MALNAEQVENELRSAINNPFDGAEVSSVNDEFKEVLTQEFLYSTKIMIL